MANKKFPLVLSSLLLLLPLASCKEETPNLLNSLKKLKEARNYTVATVSDFKTDSLTDFIAFGYYDNNQYYYRLEREDYSLANGLISNDKGVYPIDVDDEGKIIPSKIDYKSYKNGIKSFWDPKYDRTGFQNLDLKYIDAEDVEYTFKAREFMNKQAIFFNTGLNFSFYLSAIKDVSVKLNDNNELSFYIDLGEYGSLREDIIDMGKTKIPEIKEFLDNGGKEQDSILSKSQSETLKLLKANNYREELGEVPVPGSNSGEKIKQGAIYYHPDYYFIDYTDEYIKLYYDTYKTKIVDGGYYQDGDNVVEFEAPKEVISGQLKQTIKVKGEPKKNTTVSKEALYLSETNLIKEYAHAQEAFLPLSNGYLPFNELQDFELAKEIGISAFHLNETEFQDAAMLMQSYACGMTDVIEDNFIILYAINEGVDVSYFPLFYDKFGKTHVDLVEDYLQNLHK